MDDRVVPRGHDLSCVLSCWIPRRRNIRICTLEDSERLNFRREITPERVRSRNVTAQRSERGRLRIDLKWNMIRVKSVCGERHQGRKGMSPYQLMQSLNLCLFKMLRI